MRFDSDGNPQPRSWWRPLLGFRAVLVIDRLEPSEFCGYKIAESHFEWNRAKP